MAMKMKDEQLEKVNGGFKIKEIKQTCPYCTKEYEDADLVVDADGNGHCPHCNAVLKTAEIKVKTVS